MADTKQKKFVAANNPAEILKDTAQEIVSVPKAILDEALGQIGLKPQKKPLMGEISVSSGIHKTNSEIAGKDAGIDAKMRQLQYVQKQEHEIFNSKQKAIQEQVGKLMQELHMEVVKLQQQTAELTSATRASTVEVVPPQAGIYHLNFIDWVMSTLRDLRKTVNESRMWLNMWSQKKKQKGYWNMTKKHGQKFQFSDERSVATAAG